MTSSKFLWANISGKDTDVELFRNTAAGAETCGGWLGFLGSENSLELVGALEPGGRLRRKSTAGMFCQLPAEENITCSDARGSQRRLVSALFSGVKGWECTKWKSGFPGPKNTCVTHQPRQSAQPRSRAVDDGVFLTRYTLPIGFFPTLF